MILKLKVTNDASTTIFEGSLEDFAEYVGVGVV